MRPIDCETRAFLELLFGHDFSQVRLYADEKAAESSRAFHARPTQLVATLCSLLVITPPGTTSHMSLLAHELAHVVQQMGEPSPVLRRAPAPDALSEYKTK